MGSLPLSPFLQQQLQAKMSEEQDQHALKAAMDVLQLQLWQAREDLERTTEAREVELNRHRQESEEFQKKSLEEIQLERHRREEAERQAKDAWERTQAETAAMRGQLQILQDRMAGQTTEISCLEVRVDRRKKKGSSGEDYKSIRHLRCG